MLSTLVTAGLGVRIGYAGFFEQARISAEEGARLAIRLAQPGAAIEGIDPTMAVTAALQVNALAPLTFFLFTPVGWIATYLFTSGIYRAITLAVDHPKGDPILTFIDTIIHGTVGRGASLLEGLAATRLGGLLSGDQIQACRAFAGREADFVVIAGSPKRDWTAGTTVVARSIRLRVGQSRDVVVDGWRRTCYPLTVIRDVQVDRRIVTYRWPESAPPLPEPEREEA
ncbi:MAG: hypothetical protein JJE39_05100 [Vicinamibacteria bacterium]|nr:hypothetical protein [Vicinamibacteria bacterium]